MIDEEFCIKLCLQIKELMASGQSLSSLSPIHSPIHDTRKSTFRKELSEKQKVSDTEL